MESTEKKIGINTTSTSKLSYVSLNFTAIIAETISDKKESAKVIHAGISRAILNMGVPVQKQSSYL